MPQQTNEYTEKLDFESNPNIKEMVDKLTHLPDWALVEDSSLVSQVKKMEYEYNQVKSLLSQIVTTFRLPQNKEYFDSIPRDYFIDLVEYWIKRYDNLKGEINE